MVTLSGKKDNGLARVKKSLEDNLKINPASSRLIDIDNAIVNNRYRIKDLDNKSFNTITQGYISYVIDNKLFIIGSSISSWVIEVFDIFTMSLIMTINTGTQATCAALDYDNNYIYIPKILVSGSTRTVTIMKYHRRTLVLVVESPTVYTNSVAISTSAVLVNNGFLYLGINAGSTTGFVLKINLLNYTSTQINFVTPTHFYKISETVFLLAGSGEVSGQTNYAKPQIVDYNLNRIQYLPKTMLEEALPRLSTHKDDYLFVANNKGVLTKYKISTNTIIKEITITDVGQIRGLQIVKNGILIQSNVGLILLYDFDLNLIKTWNYYNTTTTGGFMSIDGNYTLYTHSYKEPKIYKKQFIDMTEGVI